MKWCILYITVKQLIYQLNRGVDYEKSLYREFVHIAERRDAFVRRDMFVQA